VKKVRFIFENKTIRGEYWSTKTLSFFKFMETDRVNDGFAFPFEYELFYTDDFSADNLDPTATNVFVVALNYPYLKTLDFDVLYKMQDNNSNVILLADYSNESLFPGNYRTRTNVEINFKADRFVCAMLSLHNGREIEDPVFKKTFPTWMFATGVMQEILERQFEKHLHLLPTFTWPGKKTRKRFFFPNRLGRTHRLDLIVEAHHRGLLKDCEWTFMVPSTEGYLETFDQHHEYWKLFGILPRGISETDYEQKWSDPASNLNRGGPHEALPMSVLERTMGVIISDTYNDNDPLLDCSEKIMKPLIYGMPVFYNGRKGVLSKLSEYGFWFPNSDYNNLESQRPTELIQTCLNFEDTITKETSDLVKQNKQLIFDRNTHYKFSEQLFNYILDF
tara:strand:+ start:182 stop:1354 length:1173 start_codon:yes stop_codon:yes gene_type:complete